MFHLSPALQEALAQRKYFRIGEAANLLELKPHVLRYWESEFAQIRAQKTKNDQRVYHRKDIVLFQQIKHLIHDQKMTIAGARGVLRESLDGDPFREEIRDQGLIDESALELLPERKAPREAISEAINQMGSNEPEIPSIDLFAQGECAERIFTELSPIYENESFVNQHLAEVISDGLVQAKQAQDELGAAPVGRDDFKKALATLQDSKKQLEELIVWLETWGAH